MAQELILEEPDRRAGARHAVLTVAEVAAYLQVGARSIYNLAAAGEIPAVKVAGQWRFYKPVLDQWLAELSRANLAAAPPRRPEDTTNGKV